MHPPSLLDGVKGKSAVVYLTAGNTDGSLYLPPGTAVSDVVTYYPKMLCYCSSGSGVGKSAINKLFRGDNFLFPIAPFLTLAKCYFKAAVLVFFDIGFYFFFVFGESFFWNIARSTLTGLVSGDLIPVGECAGEY